MKDTQYAVKIKIKYPLQSQILIFNLKEITAEVGTAEVLIENIGPGGLRFLSNLKLETNQEIIYSFEAERLTDSIQLSGEIIWTNELPDGLYQYGAQFNIEASRREFLTELLNFYSQKYFKTIEQQYSFID